jgi:gas vesicle protein
MKKGTNIAFGAIIGAAVGVAAGILTAPKSGKETRDDIKQKADTVKSQVSKTGNDFIHKADEVTDEVRNKAKEAMNSVRHTDKKK